LVTYPGEPGGLAGPAGCREPGARYAVRKVPALTGLAVLDLARGSGLIRLDCAESVTPSGRVRHDRWSALDV